MAFAPPTSAADEERAALQRELGALYDEHAARLYAVAHRLLGVREEAEECVQDLFVALARSRTERERIEDMRAYLFASLRRLAGARGRAQSRRAQLQDVLARSGEPHAGAPDASEARALQRAIESLPQEQREIVALKIDVQLTFAEIAESMELNLNTAASRYRYALEKIRAQLEEETP